MTFLELVQALHLESGAGGQMPTTVTGQIGERGRLVDWIQQADLFIQNEFSDWKFLWGQHTFDTVDGVYQYAQVAGVGKPDRNTFFIDGEELYAYNYLDVKRIARIETQGKPYQVVIMPDGRYRFEHVPDQPYTITFDGWTTPLPMVNGGDNSLIPARFHHAIIGQALLYYAEYEAAQEVEKKGLRMFGLWHELLMADQLPGDRHMHTTAEDNEMVIVVE